MFSLVLYTLYARVAQSLPSTSYIKMIEIWLLFHLIIPFFIFFILFWKEHKQDPKINVSSKNIAPKYDFSTTNYFNIFSTIILPITIITFVIIFFFVCFINYI